MLPYAPIHHLLFARGAGQLGSLVMTSGNLSDEPLAIDNREAVRRLGPLTDAILYHDRPIERAVDDSVLIDCGSTDPLPIRRSRGFVPQTMSVPVAAPAEAAEGLCVGGELKNTLAVVRGRDVVLSQHLGDLTHPLAFDYFKRAADDFRSLFDIRPQWVAGDLHPAYLSSGHGRLLAERWNVPWLGIQHHHAHAAAVMAEHNHPGAVLAVVCDGVGYGTDRTIWGGELLVADLLRFRRLARLRPLRLAGGDAAARDTRRCGLALLHQLTGDIQSHPIAQRMVPDPSQRAIFRGMLRRGVQCVDSSSAGRLFDGVAALLGLCDYNQFEAQAGMRLEAAASRVEPADRSHDGRVRQPQWFKMVTGRQDRDLITIDMSPLVQHLITLQGHGEETSLLAYLFHEQLAAAWEAAVAKAADRTGLTEVALSGGVFCNQLLTELLGERLRRRGLRVLRHRYVPPNDGGLALGQAAIAAARMGNTENETRSELEAAGAASDRIEYRSTA
jgi:hydrogenase maturation protein HypF